jgi:ATP-dependent DNA helicase
LRRIEAGEEDLTLNGFDEDDDTPLLSSEAEEIERAHTLKLAKKEIATKKLQNPIMQARLACNSPHNFYWPWGPTTVEEEENEDYPEVDETLITASGKLLLLDTLLPRLFKLGHKVLIFSQFKTTLDILETYTRNLRGWQCCRIDGSIAQSDRHEQIQLFNTDKKFNLFLLSTRAGGQGINLTAADTVVLYDSDWNPQQDLQAMDRAHRIGQTRPVIVYRLATRGTVEETLLLKADGKRKLEKLVIQKGKFKSLFDGVDGKTKGLSKADAEELQGVLANEDFEKYDIDDSGGEVLSEEELAILTDRSEKAYERAEKGEEGASFKVAETKRTGQGGVLDDFTTKSGSK